MAGELDKSGNHFCRRANCDGADATHQCLYDDDSRLAGFGRADVLALRRAEPDAADHLFCGVLDRGSTLVRPVSGICFRTGAAWADRAIYGLGADSVAFGEGNDRA